MRIQALHIASKTRAWFEFEINSSESVKVITPDGKEYFLIREQILTALGIKEDGEKDKAKDKQEQTGK